MGLFSSGKPELEIDKQDKLFAEDILLWLAITLGDEIPRNRSQLFPVSENFNYKNLKDNDELFRLIRQVAELIELNDKNVSLELYSSEELKWKEYFPFDNSGENKEQMSSLFLPDQVLAYPELTFRSVMLQLLEKKFNPEILEQNMLQWTAEIAADYYGLGLISLRNTNEYINIKTGRDILLSYDIHVYVTCLLYELTGNSRKGIELYLSADEYKRIERMSKAIKNSEDFLNFKKEWDLALKKHPLFLKEIKLANYDLEKIELYNELISLDKKRPNPGSYNGRGYVYLLHNRYAEAIDDFNLAIEVDPYHAYAFDNRGFCKLMLGDLKGGLEDIETSLRLDPGNSYSFRNKGIYYFIKGDFSLALEYYLKAKEKQGDVEHIHFHLGTAYLALNDKDKAQREFEHSRKIPELPAPDYPEGY